MPSRLWKRCVGAVIFAAISCLTIFAVTDAPAKAAGKESVTVSIVLALAAG